MTVDHLPFPTDIGIAGTSLYDLVKAARSLGFEASAWHARIADLAAVPIPAVLHLELFDAHHYVVLVDMDDRDVLVMDPAGGVMKTWPLALLERHWSGHILLLERKRAFATFLSWLRQCIRGMFRGEPRLRVGSEVVRSLRTPPPNGEGR